MILYDSFDFMILKSWIELYFIILINKIKVLTMGGMVKCLNGDFV